MTNAKISVKRSQAYYAFLTAFCFIFILPVAVVNSNQGGLPVDLIPSDFLAALILIAAMLRFTAFPFENRAAKLQLCFVAYAFVLATLTLLLTEDISVYFSFVKFCKVFLAFFAGHALAAWFGRDLVLRALALAAFIYLLTLTFSQFVYHADFTPRLGANFFDIPIYGFPNSPSSYLVFLLCIALAQSRSVPTKALLIALASIFALGSLSRAAALMILIAFFAFALNTPKRLLATAGAAVVILALSVGLDLYSSLGLDKISDGIMRRVEAAQRSGDLTNGRLEIVDLTIGLISDRPVFGYGFQSFSEFASHGTPHNQYLEVWFKAGLAGLLLYLSIIFYATRRIWKATRSMPRDLSTSPYIVMIGLALIGNFALPNLSYSATGNLVFLVFGLFAYFPQSYRIPQSNGRSPHVSSLINA